MIEIKSDWRPVAFKEWQLIADALVQGEQSVILRKGGISEGKAGFQWLHDRFFLFPSLFRGAVAARGSETAEDEIAFSGFLETVTTGRLTSWNEVLRLRPFHIWKDEIIRERFEWGDEHGISYAIVKAYPLKKPWLLKDRKSFGGCRSWFGMPPEENGGWQSVLADANSVDPACGIPEWLI